MAATTTDPLERAVLSGALFAGPDPEGKEPQRSSDGYKDEQSDNEQDGEQGQTDVGFVSPADDVPATNTSGSTTTKGPSRNTGVKGVLADYKKNNAARKSSEVPSLRKGPRVSTDAGVDSDGNLSEGEREAKESYRRHRIQEMMKMGSGERHTNGSINGHRHDDALQKKKFGHLREIGRQQFVKATEEKGDVIVIVHVYESYLPACKKLNLHLSSLARSYPYTKFVRAVASELEFASGSEKEVLPTLLIYQRGEVLKTLVAFQRDLEGASESESESGWTLQTVEDLLTSYGVLDPSLAVRATSASDDDYDSE